VVRRTAIRTALAVLAAVALLASAACSDGTADRGNAGANPTVATDPPGNPTIATAPLGTTTTNPYAVPALIDDAYINRVLAGLDSVMGDATRAVVRTKTFTSEAYDRLRAIYSDNSLLQLVVDAVEEEIGKSFSGYKPNPGNRLTTVTRVLTAQPDCIFVRVQRDYSAMSPNPGSPDPQWVALRPLERTRDPRGYNRTSWALIYDGFSRDRTQPENPCSR
jgi:hypothetical protein